MSLFLQHLSMKSYEYYTTRLYDHLTTMPLSCLILALRPSLTPLPWHPITPSPSVTRGKMKKKNDGLKIFIKNKIQNLQKQTKKIEDKKKKEKKRGKEEKIRSVLHLLLTLRHSLTTPPLRNG